MGPIEESWKRCGQRLRVELGEDIFTSWFSSLALESIVAGRARFSVSTKFLKSWIEGHYRERILAALEAEIGGIVALEVSVRTPNSTLAARTAKSDPRLQSPATDADGGATSKSTPMADPAGRRSSLEIRKQGFLGCARGIAARSPAEFFELSRRSSQSTGILGGAARVSRDVRASRPQSARYIFTPLSAWARRIYFRRSRMRRPRKGARSFI